jgi:dihydropteroate synthase
MGIVNATPDSFSDGGEFLDPDAAIAHGRAMVAEGASYLDVGGESTRPGATIVGADEELRRVVPVISGLRDLPVEISIDTTKAVVAEAALAAGASMVNDVSALRIDPEMAALCAHSEADVVLMHACDPLHTVMTDRGDLLESVKAFLADRIERALAAGIEESRIRIDPGIGFGKHNPEGNLELLRRLGELGTLGRPVLVGTSRKSFIGRLDGSSVAQRIGGTVASSLAAAERGADVLRVHEVGPVVQALKVAAAIAETQRLWVRTPGEATARPV